MRNLGTKYPGIRALVIPLAAVLVLALCLTMVYVLDGKRHVRERDIVKRLFSEDNLRGYANIYGSKALLDYVVHISQVYEAPNQHQVGHALGEVLYEREGLKALGLCRDSFTYGCLHQVIGEAYEEKGSWSLDELIDACQMQESTDYRECLHAIGHALVYANGYNQSSLDKSLATCDEVQNGVPFDYEDSCYGGAFMEYNMHFMSDNEGAFSTGRPYDSQSPEQPCDSLQPDKNNLYRATCGFWLIPWMHGQISEWRTDVNSFRALGAFCTSMTDETMRIACAYAIGRQLGVRGTLSSSVITSMCRTALSENTPYDRCIFGAVHILQKRHPDTVKALCSSLNQEKKNVCMAFATTTETIWE